MGRDLSVTIIGCGAMTADITWLAQHISSGVPVTITN